MEFPSLKPRQILILPPSLPLPLKQIQRLFPRKANLTPFIIELKSRQLDTSSLPPNVHRTLDPPMLQKTRHGEFDRRDVVREMAVKAKDRPTHVLHVLVTEGECEVSEIVAAHALDPVGAHVENDFCEEESGTS